MALSEMLLGYLGEQTPTPESAPAIKFRGGDKVQYTKNGRIGYIADGCCGGVKENERLVLWGWGSKEGIITDISNLRLLESSPR